MTTNSKLVLAVGLAAATLALILTIVLGGPAVLQSAGEEISSPSISAAAADVDTNITSAANVTLNLGNPFLIQNDTETGANVIRVEGSRIIEGTFATQIMERLRLLSIVLMTLSMQMGYLILLLKVKQKEKKK
jgi:hypothetical protein